MSKVLGLWSGLSGTVLDYAGSTAPAGWLLCYGQSLLRTDYPNLFVAIGTTYGAADGTHFNVPDCRGRGVAGKDDMGGTGAGALNVTLTGTKASTSSGVITGLSSTAGLSVGMLAFGTGIGASAVVASIDSASQVTLSVNSTTTGSTSIRFGVVDGATLGAVGGSHVHTIAAGQLPAHAHPVTDPGHTHNIPMAVHLPSGGDNFNTPWAGGVGTALATASTTTGLTVGNNTGGGGAHPNVQPTIVFNKIIRT